MTSYNHVGPGHASSVLAAKTLGRVPDIPNPSDLLIVNKVRKKFRVSLVVDNIHHNENLYWNSN